MKIEDYPDQEPLSDIGATYNKECLRLSEGISGHEAAYAHVDLCQGVIVYPAEKPNGIVLLYFHGGGWTNGFKEMMGFMAPPMNKAGITFVSSSYRMAPKTTFPDGWMDSARALAWVYNNIQNWGGDPAKIFIGGHSAGGHYTSLLGVRSDWQTNVGVPQNIVKGVLPISGIYWFGEGSGLAVYPRFLGPESLGHHVGASPMLQLDGLQTPPMLLAHGDRDFPHLIVQAQKFEKALIDKGCDVERLEMQGRTHFSACYSAGEFDGPWVRRAIDWMTARV